MTGRLRHVVLAVAAVLAGACGGSSAVSRIGPGGAKAVNLDPVNPKAGKEFEAAMRALRLGGPEASETAKARLKAALEIDGKLWEAWHDLGALAYKDGDDDAAIDAYSKALGINPASIATMLGRAEAYRRAGKKKDARADYELALRSTEQDDPIRRDAAARLASLLRDFGDFDDAVAVLRDTVRLSGITAWIYTELGLIYIQQKRPELAQLVLANMGIEPLELAGGGIDPFDPAGLVIGRRPRRTADRAVFTKRPVEAAIVADIDRAVRPHGRSVGDAAQIGDEFAPAVPHPRQGAAKDFDDHRRTVGKGHRPFGELQAFRQDVEPAHGRNAREHLTPRRKPTVRSSIVLSDITLSRSCPAGLVCDSVTLRFPASMAAPLGMVQPYLLKGDGLRSAP